MKRVPLEITPEIRESLRILGELLLNPESEVRDDRQKATFRMAAYDDGKIGIEAIWDKPRSFEGLKRPGIVYTIPINHVPPE